ncbi:XRCC4-like factor-domain-containing protein [Aspergillus coremiiformis]|uniref:Non-homologous end-joining factor 1 n=1 Tax=Aspergillus coremiiformis TaxID=138285 RepID=A0A5N6YZK7_9EURO|nr:XRCC4-like factor-domain-containing protein [Aspergillus coremiiformis]
MSVKWLKLYLPKQGDIPPLLYKYSSTSKGYELYITDLTNIWSEHLNHQDILRRASEHDTTIDPSEDTEQFKVLLQTIGDALCSQPGSTTRLEHSPRGGSLELTTSITLPEPLQPLIWVARLSKEPQSAATRQLLLPLVQAEADWESHQRSLIDQLHRKDWVLGKLFDKIEAVGIDLSTIFPGISGLRTGQKGTTLAQAAQHIKGVAPFDATAWLEQARISSVGSSLAANILAEIHSFNGTNRPRALSPPPDKWWEKFAVNKITSAPSPEESGQSKGCEPSGEPLEADITIATETDDDEFERQETPPRLKQSKGIERPSGARKDEEIEQSSINQLPLLSRQKSPAKPSKGLRVIGGKTQTKAQQPSSPLSRSTHPLHTVDDQTDSGSDHEISALTSLLPAKLKPGLSEKVQSKSRGLGVIGGKKKERQPTLSEPVSPPTVEPSNTSTTLDQPSPRKLPLLESKTKRAGKLGVIGGNPPQSNVGSSAHQSKEDNVGLSMKTLKQSFEPTKSPSAEPRQPKAAEDSKRQETDQERADRKREELKRQLEAKSKAPAKKKRKF